MESFEQLSLQSLIGQSWQPQVILGKGLFRTKDWMILGPGISITFTLVPTEPVSFNLILRRRARLDPVVEGTNSVVVAPEDLNQLISLGLLSDLVP